MIFYIFIPFLWLLCLVAFANSAATACTPGYYITSSGSCLKCPKGTFQPDANQSGCKPCPDGKVSKDAGSTQCVACTGEHKVPSELKNECVCMVGAPSDRKGNCMLCEPGTYVYEGKRRSFCTDCSPETYQPDSGQTSCLPCPAGATSPARAKLCTACPPGQFLMNTGKCGTCPPGETKDDYYGTCESCQSGTFKAEAGTGPCILCPPNTTSEYGATKCDKGCPDGQALMKNGKCGMCESGEYYNKYDKVCYKCQKNYFMPDDNVAEDCFRCAGSSFTSQEGATECIECPPGQKLLKDGECGYCAGGTVYDEYEQECVTCGFNEYSTGKEEYCQSCPNRTYALPGSSTCVACPSGEALLEETGKCGTCEAGFFYDTYEGSCQKCYDGEYKSSAGISDCRQCPTGTKSNPDRTECVPA